MSFYSILYLCLTIYMLYLALIFASPFLMAFLIALLIEPIIQIVTKLFKGKRKYASILVSTGFTVLWVGLGSLIIARVVEEAISLSKTLITYISENSASLTELSTRIQAYLSPITEDLNLDLDVMLKSMVTYVQSILGGISNLLINIIQGVPNMVVNILMFIVALFLISLALPTMKNRLLNFFDQESHFKIEHVLDKLYQAVIGFIRAQIFISIIIFILTFIGLSILGIDFSLATAAIVTVVDILPILGTGSVLVPLSIFHIYMGNQFIGIGLLVLYAFLFVVRRIIEPKIVGDAICIGALSALASMYIGFKVIGVIGLFFGPAVIIIIYALISAEILKINIKF